MYTWFITIKQYIRRLLLTAKQIYPPLIVFLFCVQTTTPDPVVEVR